LPRVKAKINSKRFRQWYVTFRVAGLLDFAQCLLFRKKTHFLGRASVYVHRWKEQIFIQYWTL